MLVIALQHIIKAGDEYDAELDGFTFWHFLIDTNSIIFDLAPQGKPAPSYRLSNELYRPLAVWPFISFDDMLSDKPPLQHPGDAHLLANLKYYGRPYWATLPTELLPDEAQRKLFGSPDILRLQDNEQNIFAAFSQRILLELAHSNAASTRLALEAVKSHMRLLIDVVNDVAITRAPSEPMLAIAAAQQMNANVAAYDEAVKTLLNKLVLEGTVVDTGLMGELSYRLLLTIARDFTTLPRDVDSPLVDEFVRVTHGPGDKLTKAVRPVTLWNLLTTLVGERLGLGCQTDQVQSSTFDDLKKMGFSCMAQLHTLQTS